jgi:hypothetical protein
MMTRYTPLAALAIAGILAISACSSGSSEGSSSESTTPSDGAVVTTVAVDSSQAPDTTTTTATLETTTTTVEEPAMAGADLVEQLTPTSGGGTRPLLEWVAVDGAATYIVNIYTDTGGPYWSAVTEDTKTYVGGPLQIPAGRTGPNVADGYTWVVYAEDADGNLLAVSAQRPIAP